MGRNGYSGAPLGRTRPWGARLRHSPAWRCLDKAEQAAPRRAPHAHITPASVPARPASPRGAPQEATQAAAAHCGSPGGGAEKERRGRSGGSGAPQSNSMNVLRMWYVSPVNRCTALAPFATWPEWRKLKAPTAPDRAGPNVGPSRSAAAAAPPAATPRALGFPASVMGVGWRCANPPSSPPTRCCRCDRCSRTCRGPAWGLCMHCCCCCCCDHVPLLARCSCGQAAAGGNSPGARASAPPSPSAGPWLRTPSRGVGAMFADASEDGCLPAARPATAAATRSSTGPEGSPAEAPDLSAPHGRSSAAL